MKNEQRLVVITGVTKGLGHAMANEFARLRHRVCGCGRSAGALQEFTKRQPGDYSVVDVTDSTAVAAWAEGILSRHGAPHLLINNAAVINRNAPLWKVPAEEFDSVIDINIKGVANVIRAFVPAMILA